MNLNLIRSGVLGLAICTSNASAIGLGEITLHSRVGENLRAEITLLGEAGEVTSAACFSLTPAQSADLPTITNAHLRLERSNNGYRLLIEGRQAITEPVFQLGLLAKCGIALRRDYVLMPAPPESHASLPLADNLPAGRRSRQSIVVAQSGETLESLAEALFPEDPERQQYALSRLLRANPQFASDSQLPDGTRVRLPKSVRRQTSSDIRLAADSEAGARSMADENIPSPKPRKAAPPKTAGPAGDRLVLGTGPSISQADEKAVPEHATLKDMEERVLRMESTLHVLNQEMGKLHDTIAITTEVLAARSQLRMAESLQQPPTAAASLPPLAPEATSSISERNWLELLLSALLGGSLAAGLANLLERRRASSRRTAVSAAPHLGGLASPRASQPGSPKIKSRRNRRS